MESIYTHSAALDYDLKLPEGTVWSFSIEDKTALIALHRIRIPDKIHEFLRRRASYRPRHRFPYEKMLDSTYGMLVYCEQIQQLAKEVAGLSEEESRILMDASSKMKKQKLDTLKPGFIDGALKNGRSPKEAEACWHLLETKGWYTFPKKYALPLANSMVD